MKGINKIRHITRGHKAWRGFPVAKVVTRIYIRCTLISKHSVFRHDLIPQSVSRNLLTKTTLRKYDI